jgi:hypothetical protein
VWQVLVCVTPALSDDVLQQPLFLSIPATNTRATAEPLNATVSPRPYRKT